MDNIFEKIGLYDFFGLLIPGMSFCISIFYIDFLIIKEGILLFSQTFRIIVFILMSYIIGTLMQEIASYCDNKCKLFNFRKKSRETFLNGNLLFEGEELKEVKKFANILLNKEKNNSSFSNDECSRLFFLCKSYLENHNKMAKADKLDAIFAMSRDFIACNVCVFGCLLGKIIIYTIFSIPLEWCFSYIAIVIYIILSSIIFYRRAKRYSELRTKTIIRQCMDLMK